ncbi:SPOR domain-containing protein, partial [Ralstonia pseudosolanacearum]
MTLRLALLLLLLANGVLLAANLGVFGPDIPSAWFESEREPDRMQRQIRTEDIRLLEPASPRPGRTAAGADRAEARDGCPRR